MKNEFYNELKKMSNNEIYIMAADKIKCFNCLDIKKVWRDRGVGAFIDGRGHYDFINCYNCQGNNHWSQCSHYNNTKFHGIRICKENYDLSNRINGFLEKDFTLEIKELENKKKKESEIKYQKLKEKYENIKNQKIILKKKINNNLNAEPEWNQLEQDTINHTETETNISIAIDKIVNVVEIIVKAYVGNIAGAITECKNFAIALCLTNSDESITKNKIIKENDGENDLYLFLKLTQLKTKRTLWGGIKTEHTIKLTGKIYVLSPANKAADKICQKLLREKAENLMDVISSMNMFKKIK